LLPKRICDPFTRVDKVSTIINKTDYFDDLKLIHKIEDENKLEELKELTDKPVKHLKNYAPEEVGVIYNQFQYFLHFPKQELFGIFSID
jgi:F0F1-type ATP synthase gamma subunit